MKNKQQTNILFTASAIIVSFFIALIISTIIIIASVPHIFENVGFEGIIIALAIPSFIALLAGVLALPIYFLVRKIPQKGKYKIILYVMASLFLIMLIPSFIDIPLLDNLNPSKKRVEKEHQLNQAKLAYIFQDKPYRLEEWKDYTDLENGFSFKYVPLWTYTTIPNTNKIGFFYADTEPRISANNKRGNEQFIIEIVDSLPNPIPYEPGIQEIIVNGNTLIRTPHSYYAQLHNLKYLRLSNNNADLDDVFDNINIRVVLETLTITP